jgi:hypothetical protein
MPKRKQKPTPTTDAAPPPAQTDPNETELRKLEPGNLFNIEDGSVFVVLDRKAKKGRKWVRPVHMGGSGDRLMPGGTKAYLVRIVPAHAGVLPTTPESRQAAIMEIGAIMLRLRNQGAFAVGAAVVQHIERTS